MEAGDRFSSGMAGLHCTLLNLFIVIIRKFMAIGLLSDQVYALYWKYIILFLFVQAENKKSELSSGKA